MFANFGNFFKTDDAHSRKLYVQSTENAAEAQGWELVPTIFAAATPSAHVTRDAYERIAKVMVDGIASAAPIDAVYLDLHGAMVAEHFDDGEGEILARVMWNWTVGPVVISGLEREQTAPIIGFGPRTDSAPDLAISRSNARAWFLAAGMGLLVVIGWYLTNKGW